ncbi:hypothetical protein KHP11_07870 [Rhodococcus erythropolis]|nr:hypothetical protein [Rhodococcus erythropolis]
MIMNDDIRDTRQPMVTSLGIILGFLLNFLAQWAIRDDGKAPVETATDWVIVVTLFTAVALMLIVLFRTLSSSYEVEHARKRYRSILRLYLFAISLVFAGMAAALFV